MPVAAREASVYTAVTIAYYYRMMGLNVLLLADSPSAGRMLCAMFSRLRGDPRRGGLGLFESVGRLYERAGRVRLKDGAIGR